MDTEKRSQNFSKQECFVILEFVQANKNIFHQKFNSVVSNNKKNLLWKQLTAKVNSLGVCIRSTNQIKRKWKNLLCESKREISQYKANQRKTGGGPAPKPVSEISKLIWEENSESPSFSGLVGVESVVGTVQELPSLPAEFQTIDTTAFAEVASLFCPIPPTSTELIINPIPAALPEQSTTPTVLLPSQIINTIPPINPLTSPQINLCLPKRRKINQTDVLEMQYKVLKEEKQKIKLEKKKLKLEINLMLKKCEELDIPLSDDSSDSD